MPKLYDIKFTYYARIEVEDECEESEYEAKARAVEGLQRMRFADIFDNMEITGVRDYQRNYFEEEDNG